MKSGQADFSHLARSYRITPIQQPIRSVAFLGSYLSRLPLSPPLILQFDCWDSSGELIIPYDELPFLVCHLTLELPSGEDATLALTPSTGEAGGKSPEGVRMLYGTLIAAPAEMEDQEGGNGVYFAFPDVTVRYKGRFRSRATVMRIIGGPPLDTCFTEEFDIVDITGYTAPPITNLTRHFDGQGVVRFGFLKPAR